MNNTKKMTMKYWNSLEEGSRYRALRKVLSHFSDDSLKDLAKETAKGLGCLWQLVLLNVKRPVGDSHYKTVVYDHVWIP